MHEMMRDAVQREIAERGDGLSLHRHRVPLGLLLLSQGAIAQAQLKCALAAQKKAGSGRLGEWLIAQGAIDEECVARALGAQWSCPVLSADQHDPAKMSAALPRFFIDSFAALPLRLAGQRLLYVAFEDRIDRSMILALERMTGMIVEGGVLRRGSEFRRLQEDAFRVSFPKTRLLEAANLRGLVLTLAEMIEERKPVQSRLIRIRDYYWLRLWLSSSVVAKGALPAATDVEDMICSLKD
jgi:hypothetical protein